MAENAKGKVIVGFSDPYIALYNANAGTITFGTPTPLARGVSVAVSPNEASDNDFYADNQLAESAGVAFTGGTTTLTVDGLFIASERLIMGLPTAGSDGWTAFGDSMNIPYVGIGYVVKYISNGNEIYTPHILLKNKFNQVVVNANTEEAEIDWQTTELTAKTMRSDNANHDWKWLGADVATQAEAVTALINKFTTPVPTTTSS